MKKNTISDILDYYHQSPDYKDEIFRGLKEFFGKPDLSPGTKFEMYPGGEGLFNEWFVFDFKLKNRMTILEEYYKRNPHKKSLADMEDYKNLQSFVYSLFEILKIKKGEGFLLKDIASGLEYEVKENIGTYQAKVGDVLAQRLVSMVDGYEMVAADSFIFSFEEAQSLLESAVVLGEDFNPKFVYKIISAKNFENSNFTQQNKEENDFFPRNEFEMCGFFEDLLFARSEKFSEEPRNEKFSLNIRDKEIFFESEIVNLIFRRWSQTTWGHKNWCNHFDGETPRQELARYYPELNKGNIHVSVFMRKEDGKWRVFPAVFSKKLERVNNFYKFALEKSKKEDDNLFYPVYEKNFKNFNKWLDDTLEKNKLIQKNKKFDNKFFERFDVFWQNTAVNVLSNLNLGIPQRELLAMSGAVQEIMTRFFKSYRQVEGEFLDMDILFGKIWNVLQNSIPKLLPLHEIIKKDDFNEASEAEYSYMLFFYLGSYIDKFVLMPMDRYFSGLELVWTDKECFLQDLGATISLVKNISKLSNKDPFKMRKKVQILSELEDVWYSPCTSFKPIGDVFEYFKRF